MKKTKKACPPARRGSGLIFAVILLFVILGMVITLSSVTMLETKMNQKTKSSVGAFYNSESGVEWALNKIASSSDTISAALTPNSDGSVSCPISPDCKVYFLKNDGTVITQAQFSSLTFNDVKAVRSVGSQGTDTQRAIEAAVASGGNCYTDYSLAKGLSAGPCKVSGFTIKASLGTWGYCGCRDSYWGYYFRPPGGSCDTFSDADGCGKIANANVGEAYLCCM